MSSDAKPSLRMGIDVGGTNTDCAIIRLNPPEVITTIKTVTTPDITTGVKDAISRAIASLSATRYNQDDIGLVTIGTTHFVNALVQLSPELEKVAVIRACGSFTRKCPPFVAFPKGLRDKIQGGTWYIKGGRHVDGTEIASVSFIHSALARSCIGKPPRWSRC